MLGLAKAELPVRTARIGARGLDLFGARAPHQLAESCLRLAHGGLRFGQSRVRAIPVLRKEALPLFDRFPFHDVH